jgi:phosphoglycolate phosphatase
MAWLAGLMNNRFDLIVFDWDGTLMDSAAAIVAAINAACVDLGLEPPSEHRARHVIGLGLGEALRLAIPQLEVARYEEMIAAYRRHYLANDGVLGLFDGIDSLLADLRGRDKVLAVATGKSRVGLDRALTHTGIGHHFTITRCADECFSKPHPQMLLEIMDELEIAAERTLMVGDTTHDLEMAAAAGTASLAVAYGAHPPGHLAVHGVLAVVDSPADLATWLAENA